MQDPAEAGSCQTRTPTAWQGFRWQLLSRWALVSACRLPNHICNITTPFHCGYIQSRFPEFVRLQRDRTCREQKPHDLNVPLPRCFVQRRISQLPNCIHIRPAIQQRLHLNNTPSNTSNMNWRIPEIPDLINIFKRDFAEFRQIFIHIAL